MARPHLPRHLLSHGANIAAVNSDGDLPLDLAESDAMEALLKAEIARRGGPGARGASVAEDPRSSN